MLFVLLILIAACAKSVPLDEQPKPSDSTAQSSQKQIITESLPAKFKLIQEVATRNPPVIKGIVKNIGNVTGSVKVTAKVYYAQVVSGENIQMIENVAPGQQKNFSISIGKVTQWTSFKVFLE